jgi:signal transduction histidine kinase
MVLRFEDFLHFLSAHNPLNPEEVLTYFVSFCMKQIPGSEPVLYRHEYTPDPFICLSDVNQKRILLLKNLQKQNEHIYAIEGGLFIPFYDHTNRVRHVLISQPIQNTEQKEFLKLIKTVSSYVQNIYYQLDAVTEKQTLHFSNLIGQVTHDFTSVLNQIEQQGFALTNQKYAENMLKELLFYARDIELLFSTVPLSEFIHAVQQEIIKPDGIEIKLKVTQKIEQIIIDVELFTKALTNLLHNAFEAIDTPKSVVSIEIFKMARKSPFIACDWITIKISDSGIGIPDDYINQVKKPFFTTRKIEGHCGFGLPNAEKIVKAHGGVLEIENNAGGRGSICTVYIPERQPSMAEKE